MKSNVRLSDGLKTLDAHQNPVQLRHCVHRPVNNKNKTFGDSHDPQ